MRKALLSIFIFLISERVVSQQVISELPKGYSISLLVKDSKNCIVVVGNNNKALVDLNEGTVSLKMIYELLKATNAKMTARFKRVEDMLKAIPSSHSTEIINRQSIALETLDTLSNLFLKSSALTTARSNLFSVTKTISSLKCQGDMEERELNGRKYFLAERTNIGLNELVLVETENPNNRLLFKYKNKYGYLDTLGQIVIPPQYDTAYGFSEGLAYVERKLVGSYFIDVNNKIAIAIRDIENIDYVHSFHDGLALVKFKCAHIFNPSYNYLRKDGQYLSVQRFWHASDYSFGMACVSQYVKSANGFIAYGDNRSSSEWLYDAFNHFEHLYPSRTNIRTFVPDEDGDTQIDELESPTQLMHLIDIYSRVGAFLEDFGIQRHLEEVRAGQSKSPNILRKASFDEMIEWASSFGKPGSKSLGFDKDLRNLGYVRELRSHSGMLWYLHHNGSPRYGYIDTNGREIIDYSYYLATPFDNYNTARVTSLDSLSYKDFESFLIDRQGTRKGTDVIRTVDRDESGVRHPIKAFENGYSNTDRCTIDSSGRVLFCSGDYIIDKIQADMVICTNTDGKKGLLTMSGLFVLPFEFTEISYQQQDIWQTVNDKGKDFYSINPIGKAIRLYQANK